jgi:hypothetical protein
MSRGYTNLIDENLKHALADEPQNVYQGCGLNIACSYIP